MRPTIWRCRVVFWMMFLAAMPALGQELCGPEDTIAGCFKKAYVHAVMARERKDLRSQPTGIDAGGANLATNTKNFLPLMALSGLLGNSADNTADPSTLVLFDLNSPLLIMVKNDGNAAQLPKFAMTAQLQAVVNTQPKISDLVRNALPANQREQLVGLLEEQIGGLADSAIRFTYNHSGGSYGRNFEKYEKNFGLMCEAAVDQVGWPKVTQWMGEIIRDLEIRFPANAEMFTEDATFEGLPFGMGLQALRLVEERAKQLADSKDQPAHAYDQLLDNQRQVYLTAEKKYREPLIGPDELAVKVKYELSFANFKTATKDCGSEWNSKKCAESYMEYVNKWEKKIKAGNRFSFSGEYIESDGETIDPGLQRIDSTLPRIEPITLESARKLVLKAGWSRKMFFPFFGDDQPIKMDLMASYEDVSDDPLRQDRGVASLTFTGRMGGMEIPFGIVYANHSEFLSDVDARLSAHLGLTFKMSGGNGN